MPSCGAQSKRFVTTSADTAATTRQESAQPRRKFFISTSISRLANPAAGSALVDGRRRKILRRVEIGGAGAAPAPGAQAGVAVPVQEIDDESHQQPEEEPHPRRRREEVDQVSAREQAQTGEQHGPQGNAERPVPAGILEAQDDDSEADQDEREEGPDVGQVDHLVDVCLLYTSDAADE